MKYISFHPVTVELLCWQNLEIFHLTGIQHFYNKGSILIKILMLDLPFHFNALELAMRSNCFPADSYIRYLKLPFYTSLYCFVSLNSNQVRNLVVNIMMIK